MIKVMKMVKVAEIDDEEYQLRGEINFEALEDLKASIRNLGILQPIVLEYNDDRFKVVAGHRRFKAAEEMCMEEVPAVIMDVHDEVSRQAALAENLFREDLTPVEQASAIKDLVEGGELHIDVVARMMRRSRDWVQRQIEMCEWPADVLQEVHRGAISVSAARNLAMIELDWARKDLLGYAVENGATARITAAWLQAHQAGKEMGELKEVAPAEKVRNTEPIVPHTPCSICGQIEKMIDLSYLPVCVTCNDQVITAVRKQLRSGGA